MSNLKEVFEQYLVAEEQFKELKQSLESALWEKHVQTNYKLPEEFPLGVRNHVYTIEWNKKDRKFLRYTDQGDLI